MNQWEIVRLDPKRHTREEFDCGKPPLTDWLKQRANQDEKRDLTRTYVAVRPGQVRVLGYYALSVRHIHYETLPSEQAKGLPSRLAIPVALIGRLATDRSVQGQGLGGILLVNALRRILSLSEQIGIQAVEVDAIDEQARAFYLHYEFTSLLDDPLHLYLSMKQIRKNMMALKD